MPDTPPLVFEPRTLIDGQLVEVEAGTFTNINPAAEKPLGKVSAASKADGHRAIDPARRAFDESRWSTDHTFCKWCLEAPAAYGENVTHWRVSRIDYQGARKAYTSGVRGWAALPARLG
jgi:hypothetical protein